jgi:hypothetical protein
LIDRTMLPSASRIIIWTAPPAPDVIVEAESGNDHGRGRRAFYAIGR